MYRMLAAAATRDAAATADADAATARFAAVDPLFRVIALAAPAPPFEGKPLDPPLRSRFNAALVPPVSAEELADSAAVGGLGRQQTADLLAAASALQSLEAQALALALA